MIDIANLLKYRFCSFRQEPVVVSTTEVTEIRMICGGSEQDNRRPGYRRKGGWNLWSIWNQSGAAQLMNENGT